MQKYSNNIAAIREERGIGQAELARRIGVASSTMSRLESGQRRLSLEYLNPIAKALHVEPGDLIATESIEIDKNALVNIAGDAGANSWAIPDAHTGAAAPTTLPVMLPGKLSNLTGGAYRVLDDHAKGIVPQGGYAITAQFDSVRKHALEGDVVVVRSTEGRMERHMIARVTLERGYPKVDLGDGDIDLGGDNLPVALVVSVYHELD